MKNKTARIFCMTSISLLMIISCQFRLSAQNIKDCLMDKRIELHMKNATLLLVLSTLAVKNRVPIGLEYNTNGQNDRTIDIDVTNKTLKEVLDLIVQQEPNYIWEINDGVINFLPSYSRNELLEKLLDSNIQRFALLNRVNKFEARDSVLNLPEVKKLLEINKVKIQKFDYPSYPSIYSNKWEAIDVSGVSVKTILNEIVRKSEYKLWIVEIKGSNKDNLQISF